MVSDDSEVGMELVSWDLLFESSCCAELEQRKKKTCFIGRLWLFTQQSADCGMNYFRPSSIQSWRKKNKAP
jgi:hypothetical protein